MTYREPKRNLIKEALFFVLTMLALFLSIEAAPQWSTEGFLLAAVGVAGGLMYCTYLQGRNNPVACWVFGWEASDE